MAEDNFFDDLTLVGREEKSLFQKILVILGGITSFGALFPLFIQHLSKFGSVEPQQAFRGFMLLYFLAPLVILWLWLFFSGRLHKVKEAEMAKQNHAGWFNRIQKTFSIAFIVQFVLGIIFIGRSSKELSNHYLMVFMWVYVLMFGCLLLYIIWLIFSKASWLRVYEKILFTTIGIIGSVAICSLLFVGISQDKSLRENKEEKAKHADSNAYRMLTRIDSLQNNMSSIEKKTRNICDRYRLKSHMAWINLDPQDSTMKQLFANAERFPCLDIRRYLRFFNTILLSDQHRTSMVEFLQDQYVEVSHCYADNYFFNADGVYRKYLLHPNRFASIQLINDVLYNSLDSDRQLIFGEKLLDTSLSDHEKFTLAVYLNERNSAELYQWMETFIAYSQRRTQDEIADIRKNVAWIFRDAQVKGLIIFIVMLNTLFLYFMSLFLLNIYYRKEARKKWDENNAEPDIKIREANSRTIKDKLQTGLTLMQFYQFPVTTFMAIIIALLIPLTKAIRSEDINTSNPNWFVSMPNLSLQGAVSKVEDKVKEDVKVPEAANDRELIKALEASLARRSDVDSARVQITDRTSGVDAKLDATNRYFGIKKANN